MTPEQFKIAALAHLDRCDEADIETLAAEQPSADLFAKLYGRWLHARIAFPGMLWEEFCEVDAKRTRKGSPGRPEGQPFDDKPWFAVRDAERIKSLWKQLHPVAPRPRPPIHPHDLAAERHGVLRQTVDDRANRPKSRKPKTTAFK